MDKLESMKNQLIQIYLFVCDLYSTRQSSCFQRRSFNPSQPIFTDQELITIYFFGHLNKKFNKLDIYNFIKDYWHDWFPDLPAYQTFSYRLNLLSDSFQTIGQVLLEQLHRQQDEGIDQIIDSFPVMLAQNGHAYAAKVAREVANVGYCAAKKTYFHGVRLHFIGKRRVGKMPNPKEIWLCEASLYDNVGFKEQQVEVRNVDLFGDKAYPEPEVHNQLNQQNSRLIAPKKKPKGKQLTADEKYYNRLVSKFRQPIESLFNWIIEKSNIQRASKVRSCEGLMIHCWGKLAFALFLLVFYY